MIAVHGVLMHCSRRFADACVEHQSMDHELFQGSRQL